MDKGPSAPAAASAVADKHDSCRLNLGEEYAPADDKDFLKWLFEVEPANDSMTNEEKKALAKEHKAKGTAAPKQKGDDKTTEN